jgi:hypothetical protein
VEAERPHEGGADEMTTAGADLKSSPSVRRGTDDLRDLELGYQLGYGDGYGIGYAHGVRDEGDAWQAILTGFAETWRRPNYAELQRRRLFDWQPCPLRCRSCSRCIASRAYWARGGQPYAGVQDGAA